MLRIFARPLPLVLLLAFCTFIPIMMAGVRLVQMALDSLPADTMRLVVAPLSFAFHALGGVLFGILGPLQFSQALRKRFGLLHRVSGRVFVLAGFMLGLSGVSLLFHVTSIATPLLDVYRGLAGLVLVISLALGLHAAISRQLDRHRRWMIRSYAIGMGSGTLALAVFPIYIMTGEPVTGLTLDIVFVSWWSMNIALAEFIARRGPDWARSWRAAQVAVARPTSQHQATAASPH